MRDVDVLVGELGPLVDAGDRAGVVELFRGMSERERRSLVRPVREMAKRGGARWDVPGGEEWAAAWQRLNRRQAALLVAGCAVLSRASAVAKWIAKHRNVFLQDLRPVAECVSVLRDRDPEWLAELPEAVCAELDRPLPEMWGFVNVLAELAGLRMDASVNYVHGWAVHLGHVSEEIADIVMSLRADSRHEEFLPLLFEADDHDAFFFEGSRFRAAVGVLAGETGPLRTSILNASLRRLSRGGRQGALRNHAAFWVELGVTDAEAVERIGDCVRLLSSPHGFVAKEFLAVVRSASDAGVLDVEVARQAASIVVARQEKYLVKAGLAWLDTLASRHPERAGELAATATAAFGNQGPDVQERAVKLVTKYAKSLSADVHERVISEARLLLAPDRAAVVRDALAEGEAARVGEAGYAAYPAYPYPEIALFVPRAMPKPIATPAELAEAYARLVTAGPREAMDLERVLAAFVAFATTCPDQLKAAMTPVAGRYGPVRAWVWDEALTPRKALMRLADGAAGIEHRERPGRASFAELWQAGATEHVHRTMLSPAHLIALRIAEIAVAIGGPGMPPVLVSTPTDVTGVVDPKVLRDRLRAAEAEAWQPFTADFHQALLRLPVDITGIDVTGLRSELGLEFAAWCDGERPPLPDTSRTPFHGDVHSAFSWDKPSRWNTFKVVDAEVPDRPSSVLDLARFAWIRPGMVYDRAEWMTCWPAVVPSRPDLVVAGMARRRDDEVSVAALALLAEADVPDHDSLHFLLGRYLADRAPSIRAGAVDAALVLASRGLLRGTLLGTDLADALNDSSLGGLRKAVLCLRDLANGGAAAQTWEVVAVLLGSVLPPAAPKSLPGTGQLLALAAELADALAVRTPIPEVSALAAKKGSGAVPNGARRLEAVLARHDRRGTVAGSVTSNRL
jgi:hypothetical protein